jgi:UPF0042 nucleotide-binding protein
MITIETFGFKNGSPDTKATNFLIDARVLWNPWKDEKLRPLDGTDSRVRGALASRGDFRTFLAATVAMLTTAARSDMDRIKVMIGCTGGRHRSVVLALELQDKLKSIREVVVQHRDLEKGHD